MKEAKLVKNQEISKLYPSVKTEHGLCDLIVNICYDDRCGNGHNTFSITGDLYEAGKRGDRNLITGGCIHDVIEEHAPGLAYLIRWHFMTSEGPVHYIGSSLYHARETDTQGKKVGEPTRWEECLKFEGFPITYKQQKRGFWEFLDKVKDFKKLSVVAIPYDGKSGYAFGENYSIEGFKIDNPAGLWYGAPFKEKKDAVEFLEALKSHRYSIIKVPTAWCKAVTPNLKAARAAAIWPEAELSDFTKENLEARLPGLIKDFIKDLDSIGFTY